MPRLFVIFFRISINYIRFVTTNKETMKRILTILSVVAVAQTFTAQYEMSSFTSTGRGGATSFVTDYQACGINPANLGWAGDFEDKKFTFGLTEMSFSIHSEALTKAELRTEFKNAINQSSTADWTLDEKKQAGRDFSNSGLAINGDIGTIGFSYATEKFGGIAFRVNDNFNTYARLSEDASDLIFLGKYAPYFDSLIYVDPDTRDSTIIANQNVQDPDTLANIVSGFVGANAARMIGEIMNGSRISASWTREYNLSYGRKIFGKDEVLEIYGGIGLKYIQGFAMMDVRSENDELTAFAAITPFFNVDFGSAAAFNPSSVQQNGGLPNSVGKGFGADLGLNFLIKKRLKIGFAVTNIGSMKWTGNVYSMKDTLVLNTNSEGLNNYNVYGTLSELSGDDGVFGWDGKKELVQKLPTLFRSGASFQLGEIAQIGLDVLIPMEKEAPSSLEHAVFGIGGDIKPIPWLRLSAGMVTGGNTNYSVSAGKYKVSIPVGLTIIAPKGTWEGGIASRDAITFFTQNGPTLSFSTGFLRFRF
jgi:hypothetical protein